MQKVNANERVGTFPLSHLISRIDLANMPLALQAIFAKNLSLLNIQDDGGEVCN